MNALAATLFDYSSVAPEERDVVRAAAERVRVRISRTAADIIEIGRDLIDVKARLGHGHFLKWIEAEFGMSQQAANNFVHVAERFAGKLPTVGSLAATVLYALAAPSTPDDVRAEVTERAARGESVSLEEVKRLKEQWAAERGELRRQIDDAKGRAKDASATQNDYGQQVEALRREVAALRDERDALRYELSTRPSTVGEEPTEVAPIDEQVDHLLTEWNRLAPRAQDEFLRRVSTGRGVSTRRA